MREAVIVAVVAAAPPTLAALLTFLQARSAQRDASRERAAGVALAIDVLGAGIERLESTVERIEEGVSNLRDRVARIEGASIGHGIQPVDG